MADERQPIDSDEDELLLTNEVQEGDDDQLQADDADDPEGDEEEEEVLSFGDEGEDQEGDSNLVKHLRLEVKRARTEAAEARASLKPAAPIEVGEKPTMESCEFDEDVYEQKLDEWHDRRRAAEAQKTEATAADEQARADWAKELQRVEKQKNELGFDDAEDAFDTVRATLDTMQQAVLVKATDNSARVIYALARHPDRLAELAAIKDPIKLAAKIATLEGRLKVVKRKRTAPAPDRAERGSGRVSAVSKDKRLAQLEAAAEKTGDRTELIAYKQKQKSAK